MSILKCFVPYDILNIAIKAYFGGSGEGGRLGSDRLWSSSGSLLLSVVVADLFDGSDLSTALSSGTGYLTSSARQSLTT